MNARTRTMQVRFSGAHFAGVRAGDGQLFNKVGQACIKRRRERERYHFEIPHAPFNVIYLSHTMAAAEGKNRQKPTPRAF